MLRFIFDFVQHDRAVLNVRRHRTGRCRRQRRVGRFVAVHGRVHRRRYRAISRSELVALLRCHSVGQKGDDLFLGLTLVLDISAGRRAGRHRLLNDLCQLA